jgi:hypothetical protein
MNYKFMKKYIFLYEIDKTRCEKRIEATGMMDALKKARNIKNTLMMEQSSNIKVKFKGIEYSM